MWTYLILMVLLIAIVLVINLVWKNPARRTGGHEALPRPARRGRSRRSRSLVGALIFWVGLKIETDWPEAIGAFLISGSVAGSS